jgi:hypothetical protein
MFLRSARGDTIIVQKTICEDLFLNVFYVYCPGTGLSDLYIILLDLFLHRGEVPEGFRTGKQGMPEDQAIPNQSRPN